MPAVGEPTRRKWWFRRPRDDIAREYLNLRPRGYAASSHGVTSLMRNLAIMSPSFSGTPIIA